jgi:hypothetical protein
MHVGFSFSVLQTDITASKMDSTTVYSRISFEGVSHDMFPYDYESISYPKLV